MSKRRNAAYLARKRAKDRARNEHRFENDSIYRANYRRSRRRYYASKHPAKQKPCSACGDFAILHSGRCWSCCRHQPPCSISFRAQRLAICDCGAFILGHRHYCLRCKAARKREISRLRVRNNPQWWEQYGRKQRLRISAAVAVYREFVLGESITPPSIPPPPYVRRCIVCGIEITAYRRRLLCSQTCEDARAHDRSAARYRGELIGIPPATPEEKIIRKRSYRKHWRALHPHDRGKENRARKQELARKRTMIAAAFRNLNLLKEEANDAR